MASSSGKGPEILDLRGEVCPYTFVRTKLKLETMPPGAELSVLVDYEPATRNIPRSAREWGQQVGEVKREPDQNGWSIRIHKRTDEGSD